MSGSASGWCAGSHTYPNRLRRGPDEERHDFEGERHDGQMFLIHAPTGGARI